MIYGRENGKPYEDHHHHGKECEYPGDEASRVAAGQGETEVVDGGVPSARIGVKAAVGHTPQHGVVDAAAVESLPDHETIVVDVVGRVDRREGLALLEAYVDELEVSDIFGENYVFGAEGLVGQMVVLNVGQGVHKLVAEFLYVGGGEFAGPEELGERIAVDIVGDDAEPHAGHILEIVDHDDVRVSQIVAHVEFLLKHGLHLGIVLEVGLEGLEHHPLAVFFSGVDVVELLVPFGEVLNFSPPRLIFVHRTIIIRQSYNKKLKFTTSARQTC